MNHIFEEIAAERQRQNDKWGEQNHPMLDRLDYVMQCKSLQDYFRRKLKAGEVDWHNILLEEVYEAFAETDPARQREEMIQVAAVAVQIIEYLDRQKNGSLDKFAKEFVEKTLPHRKKKATQVEICVHCGQPIRESRCKGYCNQCADEHGLVF